MYLTKKNHINLFQNFTIKINFFIQNQNKNFINQIVHNENPLKLETIPTKRNKARGHKSVKKYFYNTQFPPTCNEKLNYYKCSMLYFPTKYNIYETLKSECDVHMMNWKIYLWLFSHTIFISVVICVEKKKCQGMGILEEAKNFLRWSNFVEQIWEGKTINLRESNLIISERIKLKHIRDDQISKIRDDKFFEKIK